MVDYNSMISSRSYISVGPLTGIIFKIRFWITRMFCLGTDAKILALFLLPLLLLRLTVLTSPLNEWLRKYLRLDLGWVVSPVVDVLEKVITHTGYIVTYYWTWWFVHYLEQDSNYTSTIGKMARNPLIPFDLIEFYQVLISGNDPRFEFVKSNILCLKIEDYYRERQIRNGLVPQF